MKDTRTYDWRKPPKKNTFIGVFGSVTFDIFTISTHFIRHSELEGFLLTDTLYFHISNVIVH